MRHRWIIMGAVCGILTISALAQSSTGDVGTIIESFVVRQFPDAASHYWVVNETRWDGDEMIVDVHTIVLNERRQAGPTLSHFLLLIVAGELRGVQNIPLEQETDCRAEEAV